MTGGKRTYAGLPNNPNYSLGPLVNSICDTVLPTNDFTFIETENNIYPNPASSTVTYISNSKFEKGEILNLYNDFGQLVRGYQLSEGNTYFKIDVSNFPAGIYFLLHSHVRAH